MADIKTLIDAVADRLRTIPGLQVYVEPPGTVDAPAAIVLLDGIDYDTTMSRESDDITMAVDLFATIGPQGMETLYAYLDGDGDQSVKAAFEADPTLSDAVFDAEVTSAGKPDRVSIGAADFYHVDIIIRVTVAG